MQIFYKFSSKHKKGDQKSDRLTNIPKFSLLLSYMTHENYCKGALQSESLNFASICCASKDNVTLLGVNTKTKSPTF